NNELNYFQKASEMQFEHFMKVFYFWTIVVTAPITAGLLSDDSKINSPTFGMLLLLIGLIGFFLTLKIFDIRCSQLRYIAKINQIRAILYMQIKKDNLDLYQELIPPNNDLRKTALEDFGWKMALTMSFLNAVILGFAVPHLL